MCWPPTNSVKLSAEVAILLGMVLAKLYPWIRRRWKLQVNYKAGHVLVATLINSNQQITRWCHLLINHLFWWRDSACFGAVTMSKQNFWNLLKLYIVLALVLILNVTFHIIKGDVGYCWEVLFIPPIPSSPLKSFKAQQKCHLHGVFWQPSLHPKLKAHFSAFWKLVIYTSF